MSKFICNVGVKIVITDNVLTSPDLLEVHHFRCAPIFKDTIGPVI